MPELFAMYEEKSPIFTYSQFPRRTAHKPETCRGQTKHLYVVAYVRGGLQGCQKVYFQTQKNNLGKFLRVLQGKMLVYFMTIWSILRLFAKICGHLIQFLVIWSLFSRFGMVHQEKSGNPDGLHMTGL
jgi:hypothetical protein